MADRCPRGALARGTSAPVRRDVTLLSLSVFQCPASQHKNKLGLLRPARSQFEGRCGTAAPSRSLSTLLRDAPAKNAAVSQKTCRAFGKASYTCAFSRNGEIRMVQVATVPPTGPQLVRVRGYLLILSCQRLPSRPFASVCVSSNHQSHKWRRAL